MKTLEKTILELNRTPEHHWEPTISDANPESANLISLDVADLDEAGQTRLRPCIKRVIGRLKV